MEKSCILLIHNFVKILCIFDFQNYWQIMEIDISFFFGNVGAGSKHWQDFKWK